MYIGTRQTGVGGRERPREVSKKNLSLSFRIPDIFHRFVKAAAGKPRHGDGMRTKNGNDASITTRIYGTVHFVIGSGDEQFPCDRIRPERADMLDGTAGVHADIPQAGMGGTQPARDMVVAGFGDRRGDRIHRHQRPEHRGHRHHQPAGDHDRVGFGVQRVELLLNH